MNEGNGNDDDRLLQRLSGLASPAEPPPLDPGLESRLLARLGRRRFAPRFPWDLLLLALLLAWLAWDIMRMIRLIFA